MTCIVAVQQGKKIYMGGDRLASSSFDCFSSSDPKIFKGEYGSGDWMFGICGSFRTMEILKYELDLPEQKKSQIARHYMATTFVKQVRECFKHHGVAEVENKSETFYGDFLVAHQGLLYCLQSDFGLLGSSSGYMTTGSGWMIATGSLHATARTPTLKSKPIKRLEMALKAAADHVPSVGPPFDFEVLG